MRHSRPKGDRTQPAKAGNRSSSLLTALLASVAALAPACAQAQAQGQAEPSAAVRDRPRSDYDPLGLRLGSFMLNGALDFSVASTDNLFADVSGAAVDDIIYTITPSARIASDWSRHAFTVQAGATFKSHADFSSEDADTDYLRATGRLDIGPSSTLTAVAGAAHEVEARTDPDSPSTPAPVEFDRNEVSLTGAHRFNRFRVSAGAARTEYDFEGVQAFRNNEETVFTGRIDAEITPRVGVLLQLATDERDYPNSAGLSSEGTTYLVGGSINFTDLIKGELSVGQFQRSYNAAALDTDGVAVSGGIEWYITRLTTITLNARRNSESVIGGAFGLPYVETTYSGRIDHELQRNFILTVGVQAGDRSYGVVDRADEVFYADLGADYMLSRRVALRARYRYDQVESTGAAAYRDYEVNQLSFGLGLRL